MNYTSIAEEVWRNEIFPLLTIQELFKLEISSKYFRHLVEGIKHRRKSEYILRDLFECSQQETEWIIKCLDEGDELLLLNYYPDGGYELIEDLFDVFPRITTEIVGIIEYVSELDAEDDSEDDEPKTCEKCENSIYLKRDRKTYPFCRTHLLKIVDSNPLTAFRVNQLFVEGKYDIEWSYSQLDEKKWEKIFRNDGINFDPVCMIYGYQTHGMAGNLITGLFLGQSVDENEESSQDNEDADNQESSQEPQRKKHRT